MTEHFTVLAVLVVAIWVVAVMAAVAWVELIDRRARRRSSKQRS
ncbi:MAG TPA: hypothetical protein VFR64_21080 [Methylomirabilota bacterium]|jgi:hypothetical protein|nr:hypothetical protein [Methylomirabilota bacterium]